MRAAFASLWWWLHLPSIRRGTVKLWGAGCLVAEKTVRLRVAWDRENVAGGIASTSGVWLHIWLHSRVPSCAIQPEQHDISSKPAIGALRCQWCVRLAHASANLLCSFGSGSASLRISAAGSERCILAEAQRLVLATAHWREAPQADCRSNRARPVPAPSA